MVNASLHASVSFCQITAGHRISVALQTCHQARMEGLNTLHVLHKLPSAPLHRSSEGHTGGFARFNPLNVV